MSEEPTEHDLLLRGAVVWVTAPDVDADYATFVVDETGAISVEEYTAPATLLDDPADETAASHDDDDLPPDGTLDPFADAVEGTVRTPYRVRALREVGSNRFAVVAQEVETIRLDRHEFSGDELVVAALPDGHRVAVMDGLTLGLDHTELDTILNENAPCLAMLSQIDEGLWEIVSIDAL